jgi:hypothetical protein
MPMNFGDVEELNPWWSKPSAIHDDPKLAELRASGHEWTPSAIGRFDLDKDRVYTLRGPRQVGKTTLLKMVVRGLLASGSDPRHILYISCDLVEGPDGLYRLLDTYLERTWAPDDHDRRILLIDEISSVEHWEKAIKFLHDAGRLRGSTVILTGSHTLDIRRSAERLPGRRGEGGGPLDVRMFPMSFAEYIATVDPGLAKALAPLLGKPPAERHALILGMCNGHLDSLLKTNLGTRGRELRRHLERYLLTGGTARAVSAHARGGSIAQDIYELYMRSTIGDLARWRFRESLVEQLMASVLARMTTRASINSMVKDTEIGSVTTASRYLDALQDSFVTMNILQLELHRQVPRFRRERKYYILDPFIYHAFNGWVHASTDSFGLSERTIAGASERGRLVEMVVAGHLWRLVTELVPSDVIAPQDLMFHWRKKGSDREVDFVLKVGGALHPVEVKYRPDLARSDLANLFTFKRGLLLSRDTWSSYNGYATVPVEAVLLLV